MNSVPLPGEECWPLFIHLSLFGIGLGGGFGNAAVTRKIVSLPVPLERRARVGLQEFTSQGAGAVAGSPGPALGRGEDRGDPQASEGRGGSGRASWRR